MSAPATPLALLRPALLAAHWWAFDLDDTLHYFRAASAAAASAVFAAIHAAHPTIPTTQLSATYSEILRSGTAAAFTDGRTSTAYRRERFAALLDAVGVEADVEALVAAYKDALRGALRVRPGAVALLEAVRAKGRKVVVVTEGPADAQEWTLGVLGLAGLVDVVATSGGWGVAKTEGLVERVCREEGLVLEEGVFVGDSVERDVLPALGAGVGVVVYVGQGGKEVVGGVEEGARGRFGMVESLEEIVGVLAEA